MTRVPDHFSSRLLSEAVLHRIRYYPRALTVAWFVWEHAQDAVALDAIASAAGMTPNACSRYFAAKIGITIAALTRTLRIERALEQMEAGDRALTRIAHCAGYHSHSTFSRAFKSVMGKSPAEYRRRIVAEAS